jgi:SAM-dependent methyltransferase
VHAADIRAITEVENDHWWYRERRAIIARELRRLGRLGPPGRAIEIGAAGGGNSLVLAAHGWRTLATEFNPAGVEIARERGLEAIEADARALPVPDGGFDLLVAFDVLEHIEEDDKVAAEIHRVLRPGGTALIAVPCDMALWSAHDVATGHVRRYTRQSLRAVVEGAGLVVDHLWSWNVLLRPVVRLRRRAATGCDLDRPHPLMNAGLNLIIKAERYLGVRSLPGVSLMMRAHRPA